MQQKHSFNGLGMNLGNLARLSHAKSRSICAENPDGEKSGGGRHVPDASSSLGHGWKARPCIGIPHGETVELAHIKEMGAIQSIWMTPAPLECSRLLILRIYFDDQEIPSVECPLCDFFATPWSGSSSYNFAQLTSQAVCVNPGSALNCFWEMPFRKSCRITLENRYREGCTLFYQINYTLTEVPEDVAYFHAQFRRTNPIQRREVHTILDGVEGHGHYVGTAMGWQVNSNGWWGEGEIKFYIDGDCDPELSEGKSVGGSTGYPTICGTGVEDYFLGSYNFENSKTKQYQEFSGPYAGMPQVIRPDGLYEANTRFSLYRWHVMDPVRFEKDLKVTIQDIGHVGYALEFRMDDICSVAFWYQTLPTAPFPELPSDEELIIR